MIDSFITYLVCLTDSFLAFNVIIEVRQQTESIVVQEGIVDVIESSGTFWTEVVIPDLFKHQFQLWVPINVRLGIVTEI
jgi:hypothetical protein